MSRGMLTANFSLDDLPENDFRRSAPRFAKEALEQVSSHDMHKLVVVCVLLWVCISVSAHVTFQLITQRLC